VVTKFFVQINGGTSNTDDDFAEQYLLDRCLGQRIVELQLHNQSTAYIPQPRCCETAVLCGEELTSRNVSRQSARGVEEQ
jgi:hypothetical protein